MTSSQHVPYIWGYTHPTMEPTTGSDGVTLSQSLQTAPQFRLRAATRPHEAGIASNRKSSGCGEYVLAPCTHCQYITRLAVIFSNGLKSHPRHGGVAKKT